MNAWESFITAQGGRWHLHDVAGFREPTEERADAALNANALCDLSYLGLIEVQGEDAATFLQSQFTNDLLPLTEQASQLSGLCNPQGRLLALFRIVRHKNSYLLQLPRDLLPAILKRLSMFVLRAKVTLTDATDNWVRFGLLGASADEAIAQQLGIAAPAVNEVATLAEGMLLRLPGTTPRYEFVVTQDSAAHIWQKLLTSARPVATAYWRLAELRAGQPTITSATSQEFIPQMVNLQAVHGVNFKKGCYPGQEIVARMQYLGKLKRRMYLASCDSEPPLPKTELFQIKPDGTAEKVGHVLAAERGLDNPCELLVVVETAAKEVGDIHLGAAEGPLLRWEALPYAL